MKKRIIALLLAVMLIVPCMAFPTSANGVPVWSGKAASGFAYGSGTSDDPYVIETAEQLAFLAESVNNGNSYNGKVISLEDVIILNDEDTDYMSWGDKAPANEWTPIGTDEHPFKGMFYGNAIPVYGLYVSEENGNAGLFGVTEGGSVNGAYLCGSYVYSEHGFAGGIAAKMRNDIASDCIVYDCEIETYDGVIGGIVAYAENIGVRESVVIARVGIGSEGGLGGGLVGDCNGGDLLANFAETNGDIKGPFGGLAGKYTAGEAGAPWFCVAETDTLGYDDNDYIDGVVWENHGASWNEKIFYNSDWQTSEYGKGFTNDGRGKEESFKGYDFEDELGWYISPGVFFGVPFNVYWYYALITPYIDVPVRSWYRDAAIFCYNGGLMSGTSELFFSPNSKLTRAMFVQILAMLSGDDLSGYSAAGKKSSFTDVPDNAWYTKAVRWAAENGVTGGTGSGRFSPNDPVTREQLAVFLRSFAQIKGFAVENDPIPLSYTDRDRVSPWAKDAMGWAIANALLSGTSATKLSPNATATRAQVAVIIKSFCLNPKFFGGIEKTDK